MQKDILMSDKVQTPVPGNPASKGAPDGVSDSPRSNDTSPASQGGQTDIAYHGGGQAGEGGGSAGNAVAGSSGGGGTTIAADPDADRTPHSIAAEHSTIKVVETSGIAEAEATGKVGTDARYESEQAKPGAG
jgi:hypothetical protein